MHFTISAEMFDFSGVGIRWYLVALVVAGYVALLSVLAVVYSLLKKRRGENVSFSTRDLTYGGVCLAISVALSFIPIYTMPYGGTVTVMSTAPLIIYCYYFGFHKGLLISAIYMLINLMQGPYIINPYSMILDYLLPFSAVALTGVIPYSTKRYLSVLSRGKNPLRAHLPVFATSAVYILLRFSSHVLAGVLWYYDIDLAGKWGITGTLTYSMAYNHFALVDYAVAMAAVAGLLASKSFNTFMAAHRNTLQNPNARTKND